MESRVVRKETKARIVNKYIVNNIAEYFFDTLHVLHQIISLVDFAAPNSDEQRAATFVRTETGRNTGKH